MNKQVMAGSINTIVCSFRSCADECPLYKEAEKNNCNCEELPFEIQLKCAVRLYIDGDTKILKTINIVESGNEFEVGGSYKTAVRIIKAGGIKYDAK